MGKFGLSYLKSAGDLVKLYQTNAAAIREIQSLVRNRGPDVKTLHDLDEISNLSSITADISQTIGDLFPYDA